MNGLYLLKLDHLISGCDIHGGVVQRRGHGDRPLVVIDDQQHVHEHRYRGELQAGHFACTITPSAARQSNSAAVDDNLCMLHFVGVIN